MRRAALGIIRLIIENNKEFKLVDLINYSLLLYHEQEFKLENNLAKKELINFILDRLKYYMKEKNIRPDIISASLDSYGIDHITKIYKKSFALNKIINKEAGINIISSYKRASNILENELRDQELELSESTDPGIFKNDYEKNLYKKIKELRKYFAKINKDENYDQTLNSLASTKGVIFDFFDNIIVNDEDKVIRKNRLELLQMLCKTFENYINFSKIESI